MMVTEEQHIISDNAFFETRSMIAYDHRSTRDALLVMAFASVLSGQQLERGQDKALSRMVLSFLSNT